MSQEQILPNDIIIEIIMLSDNFINMCFMNSFFYKLLENECLWSKQCERHNVVHPKIPKFKDQDEEKTSYRELYKSHLSLQYLKHFTEEHISTETWSFKLKGNIENIPNRIFNRDLPRLKYLEDLKIIGTKINSISNIDCLNQLDELKYLCLKDNFLLKSIPEEIGNLHHLNNLCIIDSPMIFKFPICICKLKWLFDLTLSGMNISSLPDEFTNFQNLNSLSLYNNNLKIIPPQLAELRELMNLSLGRNKIKVLSADLFCMFDLKYLCLNDNLLTKISPKMNNMFMLKYLNLSGNAITRIPSCMLKNGRLQIVQ